MSEYDCKECGTPTHCSELDDELVCRDCIQLANELEVMAEKKK